MARIFIVDDRGARSASLTESRLRFDDENRKVFGADLDVHAHTPQNQIAGINALVATEMGEEFVKAALYGSSISYAPGTFLDALGSLLDIRRNQGSRSRVTATLVGVAGTVVPAGRLAKNADGKIFASEEQVIIADGGSQVGFIAEEEGPIDVKAGTLTEIVSVISGWDSITNPTDGIEGRLRESDASYRANLRGRTAHSSIGSLAALRSALLGAGATRVRILENTSNSNVTKGGIALPGHSIMVIADGGLEDDITRAVENHRGMGVGTYSAFQGGAIDTSESNKINNGRMRFNGSEITGFNLVGENAPSIVETLNSVTNVAEYGSVGGRIVTLYPSEPDAEGYEDVGGNLSDEQDLLSKLTPISIVASWGGSPSRSAVITFDPSLTISSARDSFTSSSLGGIQRSLQFDPSTGILGNRIIVTSPGGNLGGNISGSLTIAPDIDVTFADFPVTSLDLESLANMSATAEPRNGGCVLYATVQGQETGPPNFQYRRWQSGAYLDATWQTTSGIGNSGNRVVYTTAQVTGFTNDIPARLDVRYRSGPHISEVVGVNFTPKGGSPSLSESRVDGNLITLTYDTELRSYDSEDSSFLGSIFRVRPTAGGATTANVNKLQTYGTKAYLQLTHAIEQGENWSLTLLSNGVGQIVARNGNNSTAFANRPLINDTKTGVPSEPMFFYAWRTDTGWAAQWEANSANGLAIDKYQISTQAQDSILWSDWVDVSGGGSATTYTATTETIPHRARLRASNPNARSAEILGLLGNLDTLPFSRSIAQPLKVAVSIYRNDQINAESFEAIKTSLIALVDSYELGTRAFVADFQARVESIPSIRVAADISVTSNGANIDGTAQAAYNRFTLASGDISVTFVD